MVFTFMPVANHCRYAQQGEDPPSNSLHVYHQMHKLIPHSRASCHPAIPQRISDQMDKYESPGRAPCRP